MKVALLNPRMRTWSPNMWVPLGLAYIAAALEQAGHDVSILDLDANKVNQLTSNAAGVRLAPRRDWDKITRRRASIEKAHNMLGYQPTMKMETGIRNAYDWIVKNRERIEAAGK